jgi:hypothetical protein
MRLGVPANELWAIFASSFQRRWELFQSSIEAANIGESPQTKQVIDTMPESLKKSFPEFNPDVLYITYSI